MRISDWSLDVCSSDLGATSPVGGTDAVTSAVGGATGAATGAVSGAANGAATIAGSVAGQGAASGNAAGKSGRASCRERVCQYVSIPVVSVSLNKKRKHLTQTLTETHRERTT